MASITFNDYPTVIIRIYQVIRIGNDTQDYVLDFCLVDKTVAKLHATRTLCEKGLSLANESRSGTLSVNGQRFSGPVLITYRTAVNDVPAT